MLRLSFKIVKAIQKFLLYRATLGGNIGSKTVPHNQACESKQRKRGSGADYRNLSDDLLVPNVRSSATGS